jgi:hypothetical protein
MSLVDTLGRDLSRPDAELARVSGESIGRPVSAQTIKEYRAVFGIPSVPQPTKEQLMQRIRELEGQVRIEGA